MIDSACSIDNDSFIDNYRFMVEHYKIIRIFEQK